jgi:hypothetical protein
MLSDGDVQFFHYLTVHRSAVGASAPTRRNLRFELPSTAPAGSLT